MKKTLNTILAIFYPLLFPLFFILALYINNINEVKIGDTLLSIDLAIGFSALLIIIFYFLFKDFRKATIFSTIFLVLFFGYGPFASLFQRGPTVFVKGILIGERRGVILYGLWLALLIVSFYFLKKAKRGLDTIVVVLSVIGVCLVMVPSFRIAFAQASSVGLRPKGKTFDMSGMKASKKPDPLPDIYYIILDRYPSAENLKETFGFDNSEFINWLTEKGFYVASSSKANYPFTSWSLPSSLSMDYLDKLSSEANNQTSSKKLLYQRYQDNPIWQFLKSQGYQFIYFGSWWPPTSTNKNADKMIRYSQLPAFDGLVLGTTWLAGPLHRMNVFEDFRQTHIRTALYQFEQLAQMPKIKEPTYVFAHINLPHDPFVFDKDGNILTEDDEEKRDRATNYTEQVIYTNKKVMRLVEELLSRSETPPIIVLQADEAIRSTDYQDIASKMKELKILNAYYLPGVDKSVLYPSISPVNSFRLIFNLYFGTNLPLLPDRSFWVDENHPYQFYNLDGSPVTK